MLTVIDLSNKEKLEEFVRQKKIPDGTLMEVEDSSGELKFEIFACKKSVRTKIQCTLTLAEAIKEHQIQLILFTVETLDTVENFSMELANELEVTTIICLSEDMPTLFPESARPTIN